MTAPAVQAEGLAAGYGSGPLAVEEVTFSLDPGTSLCVLGPNGGGKTTLFRVLAGDLAPATGSAEVDGRPAQLPQADRPRLDFPVSALDVALMGTLGQGRWWLPPGRPPRTGGKNGHVASIREGRRCICGVFDEQDGRI